MELFYSLVRIRHIDRMVYLESTGTPKQFAEKLEISERMLYRYIKHMRSLGAPIIYCRVKKSYCYKKRGRFRVGFLTRESVNS